MDWWIYFGHTRRCFIAAHVVVAPIGPFNYPITRLPNYEIADALRGESEVDDVAVLDRVLLAFEANLAVVAAGGHRAAGNQMIVGDDLRADEPARDVAVNFPGGELRLRVARNRPGPALVLADREERYVAEQLVAGANHAIEPRLAEAQVGEKRGGVRRVELRDLELDLRAHRDVRRPRAREK